MSVVYVATIGEFPTVVAPTLEIAQTEALAAEKQYQPADKWEHRWVEYQPGAWRLMQRLTGRPGSGCRWSWTGRAVREVEFVGEAR